MISWCGCGAEVQDDPYHWCYWREYWCQEFLHRRSEQIRREFKA